MIQLALPTQEGSAVPIRFSYRDIADDIAARIATGEYADGAQLPSYRNLAELYSVSVTTARYAYMELRARGLVEGFQGRGVFVRKAN